MSEFANSICFVLVISYGHFLDEGRMLLRSLNKKFKSYYSTPLSTLPVADELFKRNSL